ncbi:MAG: acyltransferase domain-containing protein [Limisphaerales bacterium]
MALGEPEQETMGGAFPQAGGSDFPVASRVESSLAARPRRSWHVFPFAADNAHALDRLGERIAEWLSTRTEPPEAVAAALRGSCHRGRHRRAVIARDARSAGSALAQRHPDWVVSDVVAGGSPPPVAFLFPGGGAQRVNMGRDLYETEPEFRRAFDQGADSLRDRMGLDIRELVFAGRDREGEAASRLGQVDHFMPVLYGFCLALARQWMAWGIQPAALLGHSLGEYVAATVAGVFEPGAGLALVQRRGALIQEQPSGAMLVVWLSEGEVDSLLFGRLAVAAVNGPELCVVSGPADEIEGLEGRLASRGATTRRLQIDHAAHSWMVEGAMAALESAVRETERSAPSLRYVSNVTGTWMRPGDAVDPGYYARHLRQPVRFADGLATLLEIPNLVLLEVGPGQALSVLARQHPKRTSGHRVVSSLYGMKDDEAASIALAVGRLWCAGVELNWEGELGGVADLPGVPAEWLSLARTDSPSTECAAVHRGEGHEPRDGTERTLAGLWGELFKTPAVADRRQGFYDLGGYSLLAVQLVRRVRETWSVDIPPQTLLANPSLEGVARTIDESRADQDRHPERARCRSLMRIQGSGSRPPLFVVPGGNGEDGELYVHAGLSEGHYGPEQPVYGFRRRGWDGRIDPHASVEEMARDYREEMRTIQPVGPYFLHGDCAGGPVAYEMACQCAEAGEEVGMLLLTDSLCPRPFELVRYAVTGWARRLRRNPVFSVIANLVELLSLRGPARSAFLEKKREAIRRRLGGVRKETQDAAPDSGTSVASVPAADPVRGGLTARHVGESEFWTPGGLHYWRVTQRARPRPYSGRVEIIVSEERSRLERVHRWRKFAPDTRIEVVSGSHWLYLWHHGDRVVARIVECQSARAREAGRGGDTRLDATRAKA